MRFLKVLSLIISISFFAVACGGGGGGGGGTSASVDSGGGTITANGYDLVLIQKAGGTFTTSDLAGTWNLHSLTSGDGPQWTGWYYGTINFNNSGNGTISGTDSDGGTDINDPVSATIDNNGVVSSLSNPSFHGVMSQDKNLIVATMNDGGGGGYNLIIGQRAGGSFTTSDLAGTWNFHGITSGDAPQWNGWFYGQVLADASGNLSFISYLDSDGDPSLPDAGPLAISSDGIVTDASSPSFHGKMSLGTDLIVATINSD
jgi:hypothetical protein